MELQGQEGRSERGYAMAALLVAIGVMSVLLSVAMPTWRQMMQREKEEELIFRGQQYARAIGLFQRKYAAAYPPDVDTLLKQKFLRKKYRDPMVEDGEFQVLYQGSQTQPGVPGQSPQQRGGQQQPGQQQGPQQQGQRGRPGFGAAAPRQQQGAFGPVGPRGGVIGVASKSTETSIRIYNGRNHYNEWQFIYAPALFGPGQQRPGMRPGQRGPAGSPRPGTRPGGPGPGGPAPRGNPPSTPRNPG